MNVFKIKNNRFVQFFVLFLLAMSIAFSFAPIVANAQAAAPVTAASQPQTGGSWCEGLWKAANPMCWIRSISVGGSMIVIFLSGWILSIAGTLMNASLELTVGSGQAGTGFDAQIYSRIQGGVESVWTAFRDIANIVIIGMFTFIALTMILGMERFNARQMVAKVLLVAVLINFSLLFTRLIIAMSNFLAFQFYKAAQFGAETSSAAGALFSFGGYSTGISGKFAQLLGVTSVLETGDALWKAELGWWDPGIMTLALGALATIAMIVAALMFFYIAFLLISRAILFIFLLITSSLAFASYLIPGGSIGGYGWSAWWNSLLKNAVFAPLLLMFLWATIQVGTGIKTLSGSGTLGGLLADPTKGGNINALFSYLLIIGMLYVSIKVSSSFAHKIGGFNYAAMAPALGAGMLGRFGGFLGRQSLGRLGLSKGAAWDERAKNEANKSNPNKFAQRMYEFGAAGAKGFAKRDYNFMNTQIGKEIGKVSATKDIAGKAIGGFEATQKKFIEKQQELAKKQSYTEEERRKIVEKGMEAEKASNKALGDRYKLAEEGHKASKEHAEKEKKAGEEAQNAIIKKFDSQITSMRKSASDAQAAVDASDTPATRGALKKARGDLKQVEQARRSELAFEQERIKSAERSVNIARKEVLDVTEKVRAAAQANNRIPEQFKKAEEIAKENVKSSYTAILHANTPTPAGVDKLADKIAKQSGKDWSKDERRMTKNIAKQIAEKIMDRDEK